MASGGLITALFLLRPKLGCKTVNAKGGIWRTVTGEDEKYCSAIAL